MILSKSLFVLCGMLMLALPVLGGAYVIVQVWPPAIPSVVKLQNDAVVPLTKVLPADPVKASIADGVSFHTAGFRAKNLGATARVRATAYASASEANVAVIAVFLAGEPIPIKVVSKPVFGNKRERIELSVDVPAQGVGQMTFDFRIGPGQPGTIVFNGPEGASDRAVTVISITQ